MSRSIPRERIEHAVRTIDPDWRVREADPVETGGLPVYRLSVATPGRTRECYLKTSPDGGGGVGTEARLLSILGAHTTVPVPEVYGAIDGGAGEGDPADASAGEGATDGDGTGDLPAPCFLSAAVEGRVVARPDLGSVPPAVHEGIARSVGRHLASVHALDPFDAYGYLRAVDGGNLQGERPPSDLAAVAVRDPTDDWRERLRMEADHEVSKAGDTRFGDAAVAAGPVLQDRIDDLSGEFRPVLCHVDFSVENLPHDPATGEVRGLIDWAFSVSGPRDYDLLYAVRSLSGGHLRLLPGFPDRRERVRAALLAGYREGAAGTDEAAATAAIERYRANRDAYRLLAAVRTANIFESAFDDAGIEGERREAAARALCERISGFD